MADYFIVVGTLLLSLVCVAILVAAFELVRQRQALERLRRDRATFAVSCPLPLVAALARADSGPEHATPPNAAAPLAAPAAAAVVRRDPTWIETRPMVLGFDTMAASEAERRSREVDLLIG